MSPGSTTRVSPVRRSSTLSVVRFSRYAISRPSGDHCGWNASASVPSTSDSRTAVALKKSGSAASVSVLRNSFQRPSRSPAYSRLRPSGEKLTERSCSGVFVMRRVSPCSTEATNTSPRATNATSRPFGDTSNSVALPVTSNGTTGRLRRSAATMTSSFVLSLAPAGRTRISPPRP
jgi:hypothetical protein